MGSGTDHALWLRGVLIAERERRGWSLSDTARAIAREMGAGGHLSKQSLDAWEKFRAQPRIDQFSAWARALGLRLEVDLVPREEGAVSVRLPKDVADIARQIVLLAPEDRSHVVAMIDRLQR
jgi:transcriptional regulator with XRE-family HTH domain